MRILATGVAGFIGSHFVRAALELLPEAEIVGFDALTYSGNPSTMADFQDNPRFRFLRGRIEDHSAVREAMGVGVTHVVNFAAETHNDRSLLDPEVFLRTNAFGVQCLLEESRKAGVERFVHVSTDEVYGSIAQGHFTEESPLLPNTPYSASKAAGDLQCRAHFITFGTPVIVTRGGNTYGPYQFPEKLIPFFTCRLIDGKAVPVYGEGNQVREWIHARDHAEGVLTALLKGTPGEIYNIGDVNERPNHEVVRIMLEETGRDQSLVKSIPDPRGKAHDARYSMSTTKIQSLGWTPRRAFEEGLRETVRWYRENEWWWRPLTQAEEFTSFVRRYYGPGLGDLL